jgi:hypothetical protein
MNTLRPSALPQADNSYITRDEYNSIRDGIRASKNALSYLSRYYPDTRNMEQIKKAWAAIRRSEDAMYDVGSMCDYEH